MDQPGGVGSEAAPAGLRQPMKSATMGHAVLMLDRLRWLTGEYASTSTPCTPNPVSANAYAVDDSAGSPGVGASSEVPRRIS